MRTPLTEWEKILLAIQLTGYVSRIKRNVKWDYYMAQ